MASLVNTFKSVAVDVTTSANTFYVAPSNTTSIVLLAQVTNVGNTDANVTFSSSANGNTELAKDFTVPVGDAASLLTGKLVLEAGSSVSVSANANSALKLTLSVLESS